jgi:hypothetical protein
MSTPEQARPDWADEKALKLCPDLPAGNGMITRMDAFRFGIASALREAEKRGREDMRERVSSFLEAASIIAADDAEREEKGPFQLVAAGLRAGSLTLKRAAEKVRVIALPMTDTTDELAARKGDMTLEKLRGMAKRRDGRAAEWAVNEIVSQRARIDALSAEVARAEKKMLEWRICAQEITPGGSEFMSPDAVRAYQRDLKNRYHAAKCEVARKDKALGIAHGALEVIKTHCEPQPSALAKAIVATCCAALSGSPATKEDGNG